MTRLKSCWEDEYQEWSKRSFEGKQYVYVWADGIHFNIRLEEDRQCILVLMGATEDGKKELIAVHLYIVSTQQLGNNIDDLGVYHVRPHHRIVHRQIIEFAHGERAILDDPFPMAENRLQLHARFGHIFCLAIGDLVPALADVRHFLSR